MPGRPLSMQAAGWYGKLPALGDFAQRRLDAEFVAAWDHWLQQAMLESQRVLGANWLDCYLTAPVWRFVLSPGVIGPRGWAGLIVPSVDRVGRYFPLTVCVPLDGVALDRAAVVSLTPWLDRVEAAARRCLAHDATVDGFEADLALIGCPAFFPDVSSDSATALLQRASVVEITRDVSGPDLATLADSVLARLLAGYSLWWRSAGNATLHLQLPSTTRFGSMIGPQ